MAVITRLERKSRRWEQVWQGDSEAAANIIAGRLEGDGVRTRVIGDSVPYRIGAMTVGSQSGILVPAGKAAHARDLLRDYDEGHNVLEDESGEGLTTSQRATLVYGVLLVAAIAVIIIVLTVANAR